MLKNILWLYFVIPVICVGCDGNNGEKRGIGGNTAAGGRSSKGNAEEDAATGRGDDRSSVSNCGNGTVEGAEECDHGAGNGKSTDGCSLLCSWDCTKDSDCIATSDICSGSTVKCNTAQHVCEMGADKKEDGEKCGDNAWCNQGICYRLECGNGVKQAEEECDDGNQDDEDGCTSECTYTCVDGTQKTDPASPCDPPSICDGATHTWKRGDPVLDGTFCEREGGHCLNGVCKIGCGDGVKAPNEECDEGEQNGEEGAKCTTRCTINVPAI